MQSNLGRLGPDVGYFEQVQLQHDSRRVLTSEMERLEPLLAGRDGLNNEHGSERQKVDKLWRDNWDHCVRQRRLIQKQVAEMGKGWEDCLFQT
ncbi:hypothetical protein DL98DRAFT_111424 [Cadophora sp. DSE1049]|nr:hypothetical protein DL98DRAFT_111424 [Cadophora sp. DSE1049]